LSTLVAAKLQLIQQWWLPTPPLLQQWWLPIVNGWCCPFAAHAMATTQHFGNMAQYKKHRLTTKGKS
jgi:hypothetical protein